MALKQHVAKFLLCVKEKGRVTQSALDMVKDSTKNLLDEYFHMVKNALVTKLRSEVGQQFELSHDVDRLFEVDKMFDELNTEYQQRAYYIDNFNLVVSVR